MGELHDGLLTGVTREMLLRAQRAVDARRGHLQGVGSGERVERIHDVVDPCLRFRQLIEAHALGRVYEHANSRRLFGAYDLHGHDLNAFGRRTGLQRVKQLGFLLAEHAHKLLSVP